jgi:hypothetical protein
MSESERKQILERARAMVSDEARALDEIRSAEYQYSHAERLADQECDELLARMEARRLVEKSVSDSQLVYKTAWTPSPVMGESHTDRAMDEESSRAWTKWVQEMAIKLDNDLIDDLDKYHDALEQRIAELEARIAALEGKDASVIPFGGGRSAAK